MVIEISIVEDIVKEKDIDGNRDRRGGAIRDKSACQYSPSTPPPRHPPFQRPYLISVQHLPNCSSTTLYLCDTFLYSFTFFLILQTSAWVSHILWDGYFVLFSRLDFPKHETVHTVAPPPLLPLSREYFHKLNRGGKLPQQSVS